MSVYKHKNSTFWQYDFVIKVKGKSQRFSGSTGQASRRAAEEVERQLRLEAATGRLNASMTVSEACDRYWNEVTVHTEGERAKIQASLCLREVIVYLGEDTRLVDITSDTISKAIATRAGTPIAVQDKDGGVRLTDRYPKPATINRQIIDPLRAVMRRARKVWRVPLALEEIPWSELKLQGSEERTRELSVEEEYRLWENLDEEYHGLVELYLTTGKRQSIWLDLKKFNVDLNGKVIRIPVLKQGKPLEQVMELTDRECEILGGYMGKSRGEFVFVARSRRGQDHGAMKPISKTMLYGALKRAFKAARIDDFRPHDLRHTFASRARRAGTDIKELMAALDHKSIKSTLRYTHIGNEQEVLKRVRSGVSVNKGLPSGVIPLFKKEG